MQRQPETPLETARPLRARLALFAASVAVLALGWRLFEVHSELDRVTQTNVSQAVAFQRDVAGLQVQLSSVQAELDEAYRKVTLAEALTDRLDHAESRLGDMGATMEAQASSLSLLEEVTEGFGPDALEKELDVRDERLLRRWDSLQQLVSSAKEVADASHEQLLELDAEISAQRDLHLMWRELVGPVVQLAGDSSVGSGVLLRSLKEDGEDHYTTYLITAWHVVRDIQGDLSKTDMPVPVNIYDENGSIRGEEAMLLRFDADLDVALLELETEDSLDNGAALASEDRLGEVRIFDRVYAVGCPLGNDPIPTYGEVATVQHEVDGETYWMINAPTYIGNSGGGIFDSETHELLGIFSKIYTHGTLRPTIVPHMGLVTPLDKIYEWAEDEGYELRGQSGVRKVAQR